MRTGSDSVVSAGEEHKRQADQIKRVVVDCYSRSLLFIVRIISVFFCFDTSLKL